MAQHLKPWRHQREAGHHEDADHEHQQDAGREIDVPEQRRPDQRLARGRHVDQEKIKSQAGEHGLGDDLLRGEPVLVLAAVQHQLQGADADRQHAEAEPVEAQTLLRSAARQEDHQAGGGEQTERQVDVEDAAPAVGLGQPAADRRAHDRPEHHADTPDRHGEASALGRVDVQQRGLRQRHQRGAERALKHAEHDDLAQRLGRAAEHRGDGEAEDAADIERLAAVTGRQPADRCRHDRRRGDVGGQDPGDLVEARGEAALHVGQRHIGDGLVEQLQHRGADRARRDHRPMGRILVVRFSRHGGGVFAVRSVRGGGCGQQAGSVKRGGGMRSDPGLRWPGLEGAVLPVDPSLIAADGVAGTSPMSVGLTRIPGTVTTINGLVSSPPFLTTVLDREPPGQVR